MSNFPTLNISATQTINISRSLINTYHSASKTAIDNHVSGSADNHDAAHITYSGNITSATTVKSGLDNTDTRIDNHINGSDEKHAAQFITYSGEVAGATHVKSALDTLDARIDTIVGYSGTSTVEVVDARESTIKSKTYTVLDDRLEAIEGEGPGYTYEGKNFVINNPYRYTSTMTLKGQLHCHTTNSDGIDTPAVLVAAYRDAGYNFITITDHDFVTTDPAVSGSITWIGNSVEESIVRHIIAYNISAQSTSTNVQDVLTEHYNNNKMTSIAHPNWAGFYIIDNNEMKSYYDFNFIEVYNALVQGNGEEQWDTALSFGKKVFATAVDDCHSVSAAGSFNAAWVIVNSTANESALILDSLRKGNFYSSTGNDISISVSGKVISASSVGNSNISFIGRDGRVLQTNSGVTNATYTIIGNEVYVRVKSVKISDSTIAWSQPIFIDQLSDNSKVFSDISKTYLHSMAQDSIINGNFNIWQRGTTFTNPGSEYTADRWAIGIANTGILPTNIIHSKQRLTSGDIPNSFYFYRINVDGAGSGFGVNDVYKIRQFIEHGTRFLCGSGKKITVSFYAKSSISNKKLGINAVQHYGNLGGPSSFEVINGTFWTLTSSWTKYIHTFETNTLTSKTFGINNDDYFDIDLSIMWGSTRASQVGDTASETFVGAGDIDIAQVQACIGDQSLTFMPKSVDEELLLCQRYYEKSYNMANVPGTANSTAHNQIYIGGINLNSIPFSVKKAYQSAIITLYSTDGTSNSIRNTTATANITATTTTSEAFFNIIITASQTLGDVISYHWTAYAEL